MTPQTHRPAVAFVKTLTAISLLVLLFVAVQTAYAMWLNHLLYQRFSPFFDSMAYAMMLLRDLGRLGDCRPPTKPCPSRRCLKLVRIPRTAQRLNTIKRQEDGAAER